MKKEVIAKLIAPDYDIDKIKQERKELYLQGMSHLQQQNEQENDYEKAYALLKQAAEMNDPYAIAEIGWFYLNGHFVKKDIRKAKEFFEHALGRGNPKGAFYLGTIYQLGLGRRVNFTKAMEYFNTSVSFALREIKLGEERGRYFLLDNIHLEEKDINKLSYAYKENPVCNICLSNIWDTIMNYDMLVPRPLRKPASKHAPYPDLFFGPEEKSSPLQHGYFCSFCTNNYLEKLEEAYKRNLITKNDLSVLAKRDDMFEVLQSIKIHWSKKIPRKVNI